MPYTRTSAHNPRTGCCPPSLPPARTRPPPPLRPAPHRNPFVADGGITSQIVLEQIMWMMARRTVVGGGGIGATAGAGTDPIVPGTLELGGGGGPNCFESRLHRWAWVHHLAPKPRGSPAPPPRPWDCACVASGLTPRAGLRDLVAPSCPCATQTLATHPPGPRHAVWPSCGLGMRVRRRVPCVHGAPQRRMG